MSAGKYGNHDGFLVSLVETRLMLAQEVLVSYENRKEKRRKEHAETARRLKREGMARMRSGAMRHRHRHRLLRRRRNRRHRRHSSRRPTLKERRKETSSRRGRMKRKRGAKRNRHRHQHRCRRRRSTIKGR